MYSWIWRHLPGPLPVRVALAAALVVLVVTLLWSFIFPWWHGLVDAPAL